MAEAIEASIRQVAHALAAGLTAAIYVLLVAPIARIDAARRRRRGHRPRILWGPIPIVNVPNAVAADRLYGYQSDSLVYRVYSIGARGKFDYVLDRLLSVPVIGRLVPYAAVLWTGLRYDIFSVYFDGGLLAETPYWKLELRLLRLAGKKIVVNPYGGDARLASKTRALGRWHAYTDVPVGDEDRDEREVQRRLDAFGRYADVMLGCADLVEDLPRLDGIFPYPFDLNGWEPADASDDGSVRIVHAPNHPHYKGTRYLVEAVEQLREEGLPVELVLVQGVSTDEARRVYERADIIADQFLIGAYALFAIEGMALGKPVVCYLNPRFARHHPEWHDCPIVSATPDTLADELRRLVGDADLRRELGSRGPEYVRRVHSLEAVGARLDAIYRRLWPATA